MKNWEARQFERDFYMQRLKHSKDQRNSLKKALRELESEIKDIEFVLMGRMRGGNKELKISSKFNSIVEND